MVDAPGTFLDGVQDILDGSHNIIRNQLQIRKYQQSTDDNRRNAGSQGYEIYGGEPVSGFGSLVADRRGQGIDIVFHGVGI